MRKRTPDLRPLWRLEMLELLESEGYTFEEAMPILVKFEAMVDEQIEKHFS